MKAPGLRIYAIAYLLFLYAPILLLPLFAFNDSRVVQFPLKGFTTAWFGEMWANDQIGIALKNSLTIAFFSASLARILGIFAARASIRYDWRGKGPVMGMILLPMVLPEMILAMALLTVLLAIGMSLSIWTIILGHVLICTPFSVAILSSAFQSLDRSLEEAAYDLGETPVGVFRLIILPLVMPGIVSSFLLCFTISIDEFIIANFLGSGEAILSVYIFGNFRFPDKVPQMMALGTVLLSVSIALLIVAEFFRRRGLRRTGAKDTGGFL